MLRILVRLGGHRELIGRDYFQNDRVALAVGLQAWLGADSEAFVPGRIREQLRQDLMLAEAEAQQQEWPQQLVSNIDRLAKLVGLGDIECALLGFFVVLMNERLLDDACDLIGNVSTSKLAQVVAEILSLDQRSVRTALAPQGTLSRCGLLTVRGLVSTTISTKVLLLSDTFADQLIDGEIDPVLLLKDRVAISQPADLGLSNFEHLRPSLDVLLPYLRQSLASSRVGVNILLYGPPGTGKSQLTRAMAATLPCEMFEVTVEDSQGQAIDGYSRMNAYQAAQAFFAGSRTLLVFEEVEDVFAASASRFAGVSAAQSHKAWVNRTLEHNTIPTIWLSNDISQMDTAFLRRFDMLIEMPVPSLEVRRAIVHRACGDLVAPDVERRLSEIAELSPAVVTRAADVITTIRNRLDGPTAANSVRMLIGQMLKAQGHSLQLISSRPEAHDFDPAFLNADIDLLELADGIREVGAARVCLSGLPGTGKTAYARWLASKLKRPLMVRRASELMSKWVGENEKNIAQAFERATADNAVLLIDEVDSFLADRLTASQSLNRPGNRGGPLG